MEQESLGLAMQKLRKAAGLSPEEAAAQAGISVCALRQYEEGSRIPRDEVRVRLAFLYKTDRRNFY